MDKYCNADITFGTAMFIAMSVSAYVMVFCSFFLHNIDNELMILYAQVPLLLLFSGPPPPSHVSDWFIFIIIVIFSLFHSLCCV